VRDDGARGDCGLPEMCAARAAERGSQGVPSERIEDSGTTAGAGADGQPPRAKERDRTSSQDPDTLVAEIEATREDLAETLDAIAERVSPKRVAQRGTDRAKEAAATAKVLVAEKAAIAKEVVTEKAAIAKVVVSEKAAIAKDTVSEKAAAAKQAVDDKVGGGSAGTASVPDGGSVAVSGGSGLPPTTAVEVPGLATRPAPTAAAPSSLPAWASSLPKEAVAGAAALLALLLLLRRRSR